MEVEHFSNNRSLKESNHLNWHTHVSVAHVCDDEAHVCNNEVINVIKLSNHILVQ